MATDSGDDDGDDEGVTVEPAPPKPVRLGGKEPAAEPATPVAPTRAKPVKRARINGVGHPNWAKHVDVLKNVAEWAAERKTQKTIAALLGKSIRTFEDALAKDKGENPLRLAFESGRAAAEQVEIDKCQDLDPKNPKHTVAWIFSMKALFGWKDRPEQATSDAPKITLVLPGHMSETEYFKQLGIDGPIDTRPAHMRAGDAASMKDVTPGADGKLPVLGPAMSSQGEKAP